MRIKVADLSLGDPAPAATPEPIEAAASCRPRAHGGTSNMSGFALLIPYGPEAIPVGEEGLTIGRSENASIRIADDTVSRLHVYVWEERGNLVVKDLGSKNGVRVNDVRFLQTKLRHGDRLGIGKSDLRVVAAEPTPDETDRPPQITGIN